MNETDAYQTIGEYVSRETLHDFEQIEQALKQWAKRFNLVAPSTLAHFWSRHVLDSVQLFDLAPKTAKTWVDFGSGAGFPGMILAIMLKTRMGANMHLIEANGKKCAFLKHCARISHAPVQISQMRIEDVPTKRADVITARALADLTNLLNYAEPFVGKDTILLFPKGKNAQKELTNAMKQWQINSQSHVSRTDEQASILCIEHMERLK